MYLQAQNLTIDHELVRIQGETFDAPTALITVDRSERDLGWVWVEYCAPRTDPFRTGHTHRTARLGIYEEVTVA